MIYGIAHVIIENTHRNEIFLWLLSQILIIGTQMAYLFIYICEAKGLHAFTKIVVWGPFYRAQRIKWVRLACPQKGLT